jgi:hypothetical protein
VGIAVKPLAIDLYCGLGGWTEGLLAEGYQVVGFDIEQHVYGEARYSAQLVLQDVLTIHGRQFKDAVLIVASPPCQAYSYRAMPWTRAKALPPPDNSLFEACFRIQREACEAAGRHIPLVVENVCGAQKWVGRARWHFGSFYLWGDVPALMPITKRAQKCGHLNNWDQFGQPGYKGDQLQDKAIKLQGFRFDGSGRSFQSESVKVASEHGRRTDVGNGARFTSHDCGVEATGVKQGGDSFNAASLDGDGMQSISRRSGSKSSARKAASAQIAKIPLVLARHIARSWYPAQEQTA